MENYDVIRITNLSTNCIIGVLPHERTYPQRLVIGLELMCDFTVAGSSDDLADTVDYGALSQAAVAIAQKSECKLLERLATLLANHCLSYRGVKAVVVQLEKPDALPDGAVASVVMKRGGF
ncbi:MAG: dihydroneopterin aldolase [Lentisphaerae bacterium]|jgi:dihydroneopterin aldolase|nr:dihydroneopterin aldolase [Lentisphaerota bacterium]